MAAHEVGMFRTLMIVFSLAVGAFAQTKTGPCTEAGIRKILADAHGNISGKGVTALGTEDIYFYSHALNSPGVGKTDIEEKFAAVPAERQRTNVKMGAEHTERIVADAAGEMAYEYGNSEIAWDRTDTGEHVEFKPWFLRAWKAEGGACRIAAVMYQPPRGAPVSN